MNQQRCLQSAVSIQVSGSPCFVITCMLNGRMKRNWNATGHARQEDEKKLECDRKQAKAQQIWCNLVNCALNQWMETPLQMILKKTGDCRIHCLQVLIHLHEANHNLILGIFWRKALHQAEDHNPINESLCNGRPAENANNGKQNIMCEP